MKFIMDKAIFKKPILKPVSVVVTANLQEDLEQGNTKETFGYFYLMTQILRL